MEKLTLSCGNGLLLLRYAGEITLEITGELKRRLDEALRDDSVQAVVIDLSGVSFMDSSGIGFLVSINTRMRSSGRSFYLYRLNPAVEKTLGLVQLLSFFEILKDESALATLGG